MVAAARFIVAFVVTGAAVAGLLWLSGEVSAHTYYAASLPNVASSDAVVAVTNQMPGAATATVEGSPPVPAMSFSGVQTFGFTIASAPATTLASTYLAAGAYRIEATDGVTAMLWEGPTSDIMSNDATGLLEARSLGQDYWIPGGRVGSDWYPEAPPNYLTIIATQPATQVVITTSAAILGGSGVVAFGPGSGSLTMGDRDVVHLLAQADLGGTHVVSNRPIAVISGSMCGYEGDSTCDVLVEQVLATADLGTDYVACSSGVVPRPTDMPHKPDHLRFVATLPGATLVSVQDGTASTDYTLADEGTYADVIVDRDTFIHATQPILVAQYFYDSASTSGDPAVVIRKPVTAFTSGSLQSTYLPPTWTYVVSAAGPAGTSVEADGGTPFPAIASIGSSGYGCASVTLSASTTHRFTTAEASLSFLGTNVASSLWWEARVPPPPPMLGWAATSTCFGIAFTATVDPGTPLTWGFGDGTSSTAASILHRYPSGGTYEVTLTATLDGKTRTETKSIAIPNCAPVAAFSVADGGSRSVVVSDASFDLDSHCLSKWTWDFDGEAIVSGQHPPPFRFEAGGVRTIRLVVEDCEGLASSQTMHVIGIIGTPPMMTPVDPVMLPLGTPVAFTVLATDPDADAVTMVALGLPGAATATTSQPGPGEAALHVVFDPSKEVLGTSRILIVATDAYGLKANTTAVVTFYVPTNDSDRDGTQDIADSCPGCGREEAPPTGTAGAPTSAPTVAGPAATPTASPVPRNNLPPPPPPPFATGPGAEAVPREVCIVSTDEACARELDSFRNPSQGGVTVGRGFVLALAAGAGTLALVLLAVAVRRRRD